ncbi:hypothetical protein XENTR_v10009872 [Xenopus tropicalis]|nr:hypothetical protein XENTR_v10009872 [Xenopus tropicalis]
MFHVCSSEGKCSSKYQAPLQYTASNITRKWALDLMLTPRAHGLESRCSTRTIGVALLGSRVLPLPLLSYVPSMEMSLVKSTRVREANLQGTEQEAVNQAYVDL